MTGMTVFRRIKNLTEDRGSTLITVIVAIAFVTILTSIILGTSVVNVQMKNIDRRTKDDFYYAEKGLNDIYTGMGQMLAKEAADQYENAFKNVGITLSEDEDYALAKNAENLFRTEFMDKASVELKIPGDPIPTPIRGAVDDPGEAAFNDMKELFNGYIVPISGMTVTVDWIGGCRYEKYDGSDAERSTADRIRIQDVEVRSTDANNFEAVISTDILIETPTMDFLDANVDVTDYCIVANKGLYIEGDATINGNVYAGIHEKDSVVLDTPEEGSPVKLNDSDYGSEKIYGGINIKGDGGTDGVQMNGNYIVSKGDINLSGDMPKLTIGKAGTSDANLPNVYFDTLRTCSDAELDETKDVLKLNANLFALNDLELNADNSKATIAGNYYGYNDKTLPDPTAIDDTDPSILHSFSGADETGRDDADSSAIIINGTHSTLDMKEIRSLVLMGRAYVDFTRGGMDGAEIVEPSPSPTRVPSKVAPTAEGVALKTNQQLYLVPTDLLKSPNPVLETEYPDSGFEFATVTDGESEKTKFEDWFGNEFVDASKKYKVYKVKLKEGSDEYTVYYAYLNFDANKLWVKDETAPYFYKDVTTDSYYKPLGTHGSVSSMEAFFDIVMNAEEYQTKNRERIIKKEKDDNHKTQEQAEAAADEYEANLVQPSPVKVRERIMESMKNAEYFDLKDCIIGDGADSAILYSQNAVVEYKRNGSDIDTKLLENNAGMERYAGYPQYLFHRYQWLTTYLNAQQDVPLKEDPNNPSDANIKAKNNPYITTVKSEWKGEGKGYTSDNDAAPLSHFVALDRIAGKDTTENTGDAIARGLTREGYGDCIVKSGNLRIGRSKGIVTAGDTFKGVAIVDGNITVETNTTVNGLLMATGVIIVGDGATINYDKGLIQARIAKEMANVKSHPDSEPAPSGAPEPAPEESEESEDPEPTPTVPPVPAYKDYYLINYLTKQSRTTGVETADSMLMYYVVPGSRRSVDRIEADYHSFVFYENWEKGAKY